MKLTLRIEINNSPTSFHLTYFILSLYPLSFPHLLYSFLTSFILSLYTSSSSPISLLQYAVYKLIITNLKLLAGALGGLEKAIKKVKSEGRSIFSIEDKKVDIIV